MGRGSVTEIRVSNDDAKRRYILCELVYMRRRGASKNIIVSFHSTSVNSCRVYMTPDPPRTSWKDIWYIV